MTREISRASLVSKRNSDLHYKRASVGFLVLTCVILFDFGLELLFVFLCSLTIIIKVIIIKLLLFLFLSMCHVMSSCCNVRSM